MNAPITIPEEFLQFIWENRLCYTDKLTTVCSQSVEIIHPGKRNRDAGPDFFDARIKIGDTLWAGNVEIHKKASDWIKHNHTENQAYENVILHAVEEADIQITRKNGEPVPTLVLNWPPEYTLNYQKLLDARTWIACQNQFHKVDPVILQLGFNRLMIERLEEKTDEIVKILKQNSYNWNETFYMMTARMFGFKVNAVPFELLAKSVPMNILAKHKNNLFQLESLLFGSSGLLSEELFGDKYFTELKNEYEFLKKKYNLKPVEPHLWKFMRLRPGNFPTVRISQFAALIHKSSGLLSKVIETESSEQLKQLFSVEASGYWDNHYNFNKPSKRSYKKHLGINSVNTLIINVVVPFLFVYGEKQNHNYLKNRAIEFLENMPPESNSIIRKWERLGVNARSAFESQALLQLKNRHCIVKNCLNCPIGNKLVKSK